MNTTFFKVRETDHRGAMGLDRTTRSWKRRIEIGRKVGWHFSRSLLFDSD